MNWKVLSVIDPLAPPQLRQGFSKAAGHWRFCLQPFAACWMIESQAGAGGQHARAIELLSKKAIVNPFAVGGITDDGVGNMLEVAANLVATPGQRLGFNQGISAARIAVDRKRQFNGSQSSVLGECCLCFIT